MCIQEKTHAYMLKRILACKLMWKTWTCTVQFLSLTQTHTHTHTHPHTHTHTQTHTLTHTHTHIHTYIYTNIHTDIYTHTHTHTQTKPVKFLLELGEIHRHIKDMQHHLCFN